MSEKKMIKHIPKNEVAKPFGEITNRKNKKKQILGIIKKTENKKSNIKMSFMFETMWASKY